MIRRWGGTALVGAKKPLKGSGFSTVGLKSWKEITRTSGKREFTTGEPWKSMKKSTKSFFISVTN